MATRVGTNPEHNIAGMSTENNQRLNPTRATTKQVREQAQELKRKERPLRFIHQGKRKREAEWDRKQINEKIRK